jgi:hypothetical protein
MDFLSAPRPLPLPSTTVAPPSQARLLPATPPGTRRPDAGDLPRRRCFRSGRAPRNLPPTSFRPPFCPLCSARTPTTCRRMAPPHRAAPPAPPLPAATPSPAATAPNRTTGNAPAPPRPPDPASPPRPAPTSTPPTTRGSTPAVLPGRGWPASRNAGSSRSLTAARAAPSDARTPRQPTAPTAAAPRPPSPWPRTPPGRRPNAAAAGCSTPPGACTAPGTSTPAPDRQTAS